jgi:hypothetical protein
MALVSSIDLKTNSGLHTTEKIKCKSKNILYVKAISQVVNIYVSAHAMCVEYNACACYILEDDNDPPYKLVHNFLV